MTGEALTADSTGAENDVSAILEAVQTDRGQDLAVESESGAVGLGLVAEVGAAVQEVRALAGEDNSMVQQHGCCPTR